MHYKNIFLLFTILVVTICCKTAGKSSQTELSAYAPIIINAHVTNLDGEIIESVPVQCDADATMTDAILRATATGMKPVVTVTARIEGSKDRLALTRLSDKTYAAPLSLLLDLSNVACDYDTDLEIVFEAADIDGWQTATNPVVVNFSEQAAVAH